MTLKILRWFTYTGTICIAGYGIYLVCQEEFNNKDVLSCKNTEFTLQSCMLLAVCSLFLFFALKITKIINE